MYIYFVSRLFSLFWTKILFGGGFESARERKSFEGCGLARGFGHDLGEGGESPRQDSPVVASREELVELNSKRIDRVGMNFQRGDTETRSNAPETNAVIERGRYNEAAPEQERSDTTGMALRREEGN